ncbi:MAG: exodeoxyribonuclease VII small subunit [Anaerolineales bacterium]
MTKADTVEELSYEEAFTALEEVVEELEAGDLPLEKALEEFERGQALAARCSELLEQAELRLRRMMEEEAEALAAEVNVEDD